MDGLPPVSTKLPNILDLLKASELWDIYVWERIMWNEKIHGVRKKTYIQTKDDVDYVRGTYFCLWRKQIGVGKHICANVSVEEEVQHNSLSLYVWGLRQRWMANHLS